MSKLKAQENSKAYKKDKKKKKLKNSRKIRGNSTKSTCKSRRKWKNIWWSIS